jgi:eukaryotic-like serine/threonine-protein kinase
MGEVYEARDTRLKRNVALKVLPESVAKNPQRRARFQPEQPRRSAG